MIQFQREAKLITFNSPFDHRRLLFQQNFAKNVDYSAVCLIWRHDVEKTLQHFRSNFKVLTKKNQNVSFPNGFFNTIHQKVLANALTNKILKILMTSHKT